MTIGDRIKLKREELNMSQDELAKKVGYKSRSSIQKLESSRNVPLTKVETMAAALGCSPAYLMGWEDEKGEKTDHGKMIDAYALNERLLIYKPEQIIKALDFLDAFQRANPEARAAVELLLKYRQPDS